MGEPAQVPFCARDLETGNNPGVYDQLIAKEVVSAKGEESVSSREPA